MLCKLVIKFESTKKLSYDCSASSVMHGALMDLINNKYADYLHSERLRPFSQTVHQTENGGIWTIATLDRESYDKIAVPIANQKELFIKYKNDRIIINEKTVNSISYYEFIQNCFNPTNVVRFEFVHPTAFKSKKKYCNIPSAALIFQNLERRFAQNCSINDVIRNFDIDEIERNISVSSYNLHSTSFQLEGVSVPSFMGNISFIINGNKEFKSYINLLAEYANYSGVGIKTALGMGKTIKGHL